MFVKTIVVIIAILNFIFTATSLASEYHCLSPASTANNPSSITYEFTPANDERITENLVILIEQKLNVFFSLLQVNNYHEIERKKYEHAKELRKEIQIHINKEVLNNHHFKAIQEQYAKRINETILKTSNFPVIRLLVDLSFILEANSHGLLETIKKKQAEYTPFTFKYHFKEVYFSLHKYMRIPEMSVSAIIFLYILFKRDFELLGLTAIILTFGFFSILPLAQFWNKINFYAQIEDEIISKIHSNTIRDSVLIQDQPDQTDSLPILYAH